jgi:hypothetical protein
MSIYSTGSDPDLNPIDLFHPVRGKSCFAHKNAKHHLRCCFTGIKDGATKRLCGWMPGHMYFVDPASSPCRSFSRAIYPDRFDPFYIVGLLGIFWKTFRIACSRASYSFRVPPRARKAFARRASCWVDKSSTFFYCVYCV